MTIGKLGTIPAVKISDDDRLGNIFEVGSVWGIPLAPA